MYKEQRNQEIHNLRKNYGKNFKEIANIYNITHQRVQQICSKPIIIIEKCKCGNSKTFINSKFCKECLQNNKIEIRNLSRNNVLNREFYGLSKILSGRDLIREKVRKRDNFTCQSCFKVWEIGTRRFDVHHLNGLCGKKSRKYDKNKDIDGLITLCHRCHFNHPQHSKKLTIKLSTV